MSDLISREEAQAEINKCHITSGVKHQGVWNECVDSISRTIDYIPSADIMECARAIKEYCRDRDNLDEPCEDCPFHFYMGYKGHCRFKSFPSEWNLPEGRNE